MRRAIVRMRIFGACWGAGSMLVLDLSMAAQLVKFLCLLHLLEVVNLYPTNLFIGTGMSAVCMNISDLRAILWQVEMVLVLVPHLLELSTPLDS